MKNILLKEKFHLLGYFNLIEEIIKEYAGYLKNYLSRELESDWLVVFVDAKIIDVKEIASEYNIIPKNLQNWKKKFLENKSRSIK